MEKPRFDLRILGHTELSGPEPEGVDALVRQPKRLALLAYIALTTIEGFRRRDQVISLFWPELDQAQARTYLRKALYGIRESLGEEIFITRGEDEIRLDHARLWCDAIALIHHVRDAKWSEALSLYRGELLDGMYPEGVAPEFQEWLDVQRRTLREMASRAAWESSEAEESRGDRGSAVALARRACELDPDNEEGIRRLIALLDRRGDRSGALKVYGEWQTRLFEEYGVEPSPETRKLANRVRAARKGESHETPPTMSVPIPTRQAVAEAKRPETASTAQAAPDVPRRRTLRTAVTIGGVIIVLATSAVAMFQSDAMRTPRAGPNSVAVLPLRPIGDSTLQRASDAVSEELTTALAAREGIVVRSATRAQELLREGKDVDDLGRRLGVAFVADGSVQGDSSRLRLTIRLLRASDAVAVWAETFVFAAADLPAVARSGAEKLSAALLASLAAPARNVP